MVNISIQPFWHITREQRTIDISIIKNYYAISIFVFKLFVTTKNIKTTHSK